MKSILRIENLCKGTILKNICLSVEEGEKVAIMGPSGSGKSTLLYCASGMDMADEGEIWLGDTDLMGLDEEGKARLRLTRMGFVFQSMNMISSLSLLENILLPSCYADKSREFRKKQTEKALALMEGFGIGGLENRKIQEVSGGQLQRACICRSILLQPQILFADEPTGALNQGASEEVLAVLEQVRGQGTTILMVTHDSRVAARCERVLFLLDGQLQGELKLGAGRETDREERELRTARWLEEKGW